ncbi:cell division protein ZapA [Hyphomicrobium methylovorum]|uniref:cell division protein ZapA n=1 Tax=Hyphomicrobium methylovorum TaxID=84 RepID=UPI0015E68F52|nr:cell division protein ZapA [Hyphomicrobium methylovorum]
MAQVAINFNGRSYRFNCAESEVERLQDISKYLMSKLEALVREHGSIGDERLMLMAALGVTDELLDARADIDELLEGASSKDSNSVVGRLRQA